MALPKHSALKHGRAWAKAVIICYITMATHYKQKSSSSSASFFCITSHDFCTNFYTIHFKHAAIEETLEWQDYRWHGLYMAASSSPVTTLLSVLCENTLKPARVALLEVRCNCLEIVIQGEMHFTNYKGIKWLSLAPADSKACGFPI